jgi:hypothetical protein
MLAFHPVGLDVDHGHSGYRLGDHRVALGFRAFRYRCC